MSPALQSAAEARDVLARGSRSFGFAAHLLRPEQWDDAARVYAFCRLVDDIADDPDRSVSDRQLELEQVRLEVRRVRTPRPEVAGLLLVHARSTLRLDAALALIDGCASDLQRVRVPDDDALIRYSYRVASTVGLLMCGVLGVRRPEALAFAVDLGVAMQLTNICRDVLEDAQGDRVYLPGHRLAAAGTSADALVAGTADPAAVSRVVLQLLDLAERYYASAWDGMRFLPLRARLAILVAARVYRRIGTTLRARGGDALAGRTVVPLPAKLLEATWAILSSFTPRILGLGPLPRHEAALHQPLAGLPGSSLGQRRHVLDHDRLGDDGHPEEHADRLGASLQADRAPAG